MNVSIWVDVYNCYTTPLDYLNSTISNSLPNIQEDREKLWLFGPSLYTIPYILAVLKKYMLNKYINFNLSQENLIKQQLHWTLFLNYTCITPKAWLISIVYNWQSKYYHHKLVHSYHLGIVKLNYCYNKHSMCVICPAWDNHLNLQSLTSLNFVFLFTTKFKGFINLSHINSPHVGWFIYYTHF